MRRTPALVVTVAVMLIVLAGCSSGDDTTSIEIDSETPAADDAVDQGGDEQADDLRIISVEQNFDGGQNFGTITLVTLLF